MNQLSLFGGGGDSFPEDVFYHPRFLAKTEERELFVLLRDELPWAIDRIRIVGKEIPIPRKHAWLADDGQGYAWSGISMRGHLFPKALDPVRRRISEIVQRHFGEQAPYLNTALANLYRDGQDSVAWHADDEKELGPAPIIASLSLGATRRFRMKRNGASESLGFDLEGGSLLIMGPSIQHRWQHAITKTKRSVGPRINLTFRSIDPGR